MIEEGFIYDNISNAIIKEYLSDEKLKGIDSLILGCTHYPIIKNQIRKFYNFKTTIIDSSVVVAQKLKKVLLENQILNTENNIKEHEFFVSDYTDFFKTLAEMFFDDEVNLQKKYL
jgi:glutamate racemase